MRLIRATGDESYENFQDDSVDQSLSVSGPSTSQSLTKSVSYEGDQSQYLPRKHPPSDVEKTAIREQMFDFFGSAREIESEMVSGHSLHKSFQSSFHLLEVR
jgi:hypothetical protein